MSGPAVHERDAWGYWCVATGAALAAGQGALMVATHTNTLLAIAGSFVLMGVGRLRAPDGGQLATAGCFGAALLALAIAGGDTTSPPVIMLATASAVAFVVGHVLAPGPIATRIGVPIAAAVAAISPALATLGAAATMVCLAVWMVGRVARGATSRRGAYIRIR
jgi:hypothetical protein|nr:hypothetical protein [Kofleriaceae bacterium]